MSPNLIVVIARNPKWQFPIILDLTHCEMQRKHIHSMRIMLLCSLCAYPTQPYHLPTAWDPQTDRQLTPGLDQTK